MPGGYSARVDFSYQYKFLFLSCYKNATRLNFVQIIQEAVTS
jgi:hypothetical protein